MGDTTAGVDEMPEQAAVLGRDILTARVVTPTPTQTLQGQTFPKGSPLCDRKLSVLFCAYF